MIRSVKITLLKIILTFFFDFKEKRQASFLIFCEGLMLVVTIKFQNNPFSFYPKKI
jgi:hypothetical protein